MKSTIAPAATPLAVDEIGVEGLSTPSEAGLGGGAERYEPIL